MQSPKTGRILRQSTPDATNTTKYLTVRKAIVKLRVLTRREPGFAQTSPGSLTQFRRNGSRAMSIIVAGLHPDVNYLRAVPRPANSVQADLGSRTRLSRPP